MSLRSALMILAALTGGVTAASAVDIKDITFDTPGAGKVVFSHKVHLKKGPDKAANLSCKSCHASINPSRGHATMADMERGKSCGKCHNGRRTFALSDCTACHKVKEISYRVKQTGTVLFSHTRHLKGMQCGACHPTLYATGFNRQVTMAEMEKGRSCGACHDGAKAFKIDSCNRCHPTKEIVYQVKATGPTRFSHQSHMKQYDCSACHTKLYATGRNLHTSMAAMKKGRSCGACHNKTEAFSVADCQKCHPTRDIVYKVKETGPTVFSHAKHLEMYNCSACHTKLFAVGPNKRVPMSAMEQGKSCGACHNKRDAFPVSDCEKCHPVRDVNFKVPDAGNVKFSHAPHLGMYKCGSCHPGLFPVKTGNKPVTMNEMEKAKSCGACHDGKTAFSVKDKCDACHGHS